VKKLEADKVLRANLANIVRKVQDGKPLNARETQLVSEEGYGIAKPLTWKELAKELNVSPVTLWQWRKNKDSPKGRAQDEWEIYKSAKQSLGYGKFSPEEIADLRGSLLSEKTKREHAERRLKELQLEREEKGWIPFEEAEQAISRVLEPISSLLGNLPKSYAMNVNPGDPDHAEEMLREMVEDIKKQIQATRGKTISKRKGVK
jgi:transcriptional regulator with XRE-family HTH domain|tara:strand:+ start:68 stop:679 length:612 start_codon:yes stop_codon:yes gene_type:complete